MNRPVGEKLLQKTEFRINVEGTLVTLTIGRGGVEMTYETALKTAMALWHAGKMAKRAAGDVSKRLMVLADLDAEGAEEMEAFLSKDRKSVSFTP